MSCRVIDLELEPAGSINEGVKLNTYTYPPEERLFETMSESVFLDLGLGRFNAGTQLTPDEARVLANQLLQVADVADAQKAARIADDELQASFDAISDELRDAEERGGQTGCLYAHPDVHYVPEDQVGAKVRELNAAGVRRFMVLAEPAEWATP